MHCGTMVAEATLSGSSARRAAKVPHVMTDPSDEADLQRRIESQQALVARLLSQSQSTVEANQALYQLCRQLAKLRYRKRTREVPASHRAAPQLHRPKA
jgi:hypothetical protein